MRQSRGPLSLLGGVLKPLVFSPHVHTNKPRFFTNGGSLGRVIFVCCVRLLFIHGSALSGIGRNRSCWRRAHCCARRKFYALRCLYGYARVMAAASHVSGILSARCFSATSFFATENAQKKTHNVDIITTIFAAADALCHARENAGQNVQPLCYPRRHPVAWND